jgi:hypothetical protein
MKYDVVAMLKWFVSIVMPDMCSCMSGMNVGWSTVSNYAEAECLSNGLAISAKATVSVANDWWILSLVAENPEGRIFTLSLSFDRDSVLLGIEEDGVYTSAEYGLVDDVPWDMIAYEVSKALSEM